MSIEANRHVNTRKSRLYIATASLIVSTRLASTTLTGANKVSLSLHVRVESYVYDRRVSSKQKAKKFGGTGGNSTTGTGRQSVKS